MRLNKKWLPVEPQYKEPHIVVVCADKVEASRITKALGLPSIDDELDALEQESNELAKLVGDKEDIQEDK